MLREALASDPEVKPVSEIGERRRAESYGAVVGLLAKKGGLRRGVGVQRATDVLLTVLSGEVYLQLTVGRGWSPAGCRKWFLDLLTHQILPPR